ncbi:MAG: helix-turn-helix domain-containing protein [Ruminococcaceae bacterium]|nr:helix-turn-helix domain-containing protein [Oscillospiraceae bacterium]
MAYNEIEQRGTDDFPFAFFSVDKDHSRYNMVPHWHTEFELVRIVDGEFHITLNDKQYIAKKGDVIFINSETVHHGTPIECLYECIVFHADFLYSVNFDCFSFVKNTVECEHRINEFFPVGSGKSYDALNAIFEAIKSNRQTCKFLVVSAFYQFFAAVYDEKLYTINIGNNTIANDKSIIMLKTILSFLRENYNEPISLEMLSYTIQKSPKYVGAFFKSMTGKTPIEYLTEYRIQKAARKLRLTDMSVTDIAFSSGFSDLSYFIKTFKRMKGVPPGKYRVQ